MTKQELGRVLELQNKAYGLLLWIDKQAPHLLDEKHVEAWKYADTCESWMQRMMNTFPHELQCQESDIANFSHLFSAFFKTSFHIAEKNESTWYRDPYHYEVWDRKKLVSGTSSTRLTKGQKEKQAESARNLTLLALEELAIENDVDWSRSLLESFASRDDLQDAINLYSYAHELVRRSQFASQGAAVHSLWRSIDKKTRQSLNVDVLWAARETLVNAMQSNVGA